MLPALEDLLLAVRNVLSDDARDGGGGDGVVGDVERRGVEGSEFLSSVDRVGSARVGKALGRLEEKVVGGKGDGEQQSVLDDGWRER